MTTPGGLGDDSRSDRINALGRVEAEKTKNYLGSPTVFSIPATQVLKLRAHNKKPQEEKKIECQGLPRLPCKLSVRN